LVVVPMRVEAGLVRRGAPGWELRRIGIGPRRASAAGERIAGELAAGGKRPLLVLGFAGALEEQLAVGDVVVGERLLAQDQPPLELADGQALVAALAQAGLRARSGPIFCARRPVLGAARSRLYEQSGAIAVEMESYFLAGALATPPVVVRVISDAPRRGRPSPLGAFLAFLQARHSLRISAGALARAGELFASAESSGQAID
jgi:nucleoside phosphorylase